MSRLSIRFAYLVIPFILGSAPEWAFASNLCREVFSQADPIQRIREDRARTERLLKYLGTDDWSYSKIGQRVELKIPAVSSRVDRIRAAYDWRDQLLHRKPSNEKNIDHLKTIIEMDEATVSATLAGKELRGGIVVSNDSVYEIAYRNAEKTNMLIEQWVLEDREVSIEMLQDLNRAIGTGLSNNGADPGTWRLHEMGAMGDVEAAYLRAADIPEAMQTFVRWYRANEKKLHPIELAGRSYQWITTIHPFPDGNGRTGRRLMNFILQKNGYPPVGLRKNEFMMAFFAETPDAQIFSPKGVFYVTLQAVLRSYEIVYPEEYRHSAD